MGKLRKMTDIIVEGLYVAFDWLVRVYLFVGSVNIIEILWIDCLWIVMDVIVTYVGIPWLKFNVYLGDKSFYFWMLLKRVCDHQLIQGGLNRWWMMFLINSLYTIVLQIRWVCEQSNLWILANIKFLWIIVKLHYLNDLEIYLYNLCFTGPTQRRRRLDLQSLSILQPHPHLAPLWSQLSHPRPLPHSQPLPNISPSHPRRQYPRWWPRSARWWLRPLPLWPSLLWWCRGPPCKCWVSTLR